MGTFKYFYNMLQKNSFECKSFFGEKGVAILFQINPFGSSLWIFLKISKNLLYNLLFRAFSHKKIETLMKTNFVPRKLKIPRCHQSFLWKTKNFGVIKACTKWVVYKMIINFYFFCCEIMYPQSNLKILATF